LLGLTIMKTRALQGAMKRLIDVLASAALLLLLWPLLMSVGLLIRWQMGPPVLFRQKRSGLRGHAFVLYKFRTMSGADRSGASAKSCNERITPLGHFLRQTSLDELPQLWNVLRGDLSLVGPRPLLMEYLDRYTPGQARRLTVKPGITGWAQIHGRNAISWEEKFTFDVWYVDHWNLWLDLRILLATVWKVLRREGVDAQGTAIMPPFLGGANKNRMSGQEYREDAAGSALRAHGTPHRTKARKR
jgi:sugar transferase EpsL